MLRSLYAGVSGIDVNQKSMDVIGNNIANVNTIGFKQGRAVFQDLISQTLVGGKTPTDARGGINPRQVGSGAYLAAVDNIFEPGILKATTRTHDLGISGNGLFAVRGEGNTNAFYTRAGDFNFDRNGSLTTPSGYRVQGWMADPGTGTLINNGVMQDIVLGPEYQVMKPRASTAITMGGILNNQATASVLSYPSFMTQATGNQDIFSLYGSAGSKLDINQGQVIDIMANATLNTDLGQVSNTAGSTLGIASGTTVTFDLGGGVTHTLRYDNTIASQLGDGKFATVEQFIQEFNNLMKTVADPANPAAAIPAATMKILNGKLTVTSNQDLALNISGSTFGTFLNNKIGGSYSTDTSKTSDVINYVKKVRAGENFRDLSGLSIEIGSAITGQVVGSGFSSTIMENNFGLRGGERVELQMNFEDAAVAGTMRRVALGTLTYSATPSPDVDGSFNTLSEFMAEYKGLLDAITAGETLNNLDGTPATFNVANPLRISYGITNNAFTINHVSGVGEFRPVSLLPGATAAIPNPYFKTMLDSAFTINQNNVANPRRMDGNAGSFTSSPINGKGRLSYSYQTTNTTSMVDVSTGAGNFGGMTAGSTISITTSAGATTLTMVATGVTPTGSQFNTSATFHRALETALGAGTIVVANADGTLSITRPAGVTVSRVSSTSSTPYLAQLLSDNLTGKTIGGTATRIPATLAKVPAVTGLNVKRADNSATTVFSANMFTPGANNIPIGTSTTSEIFLAAATPNSTLVDLFDTSGRTFGFVENDTTLDFSGAIAKVPISRPNQLAVKVDTTIQDLMNMMETYLGLGVDHNSFQNVQMKDGKIVVTGEAGVNNNIDYLRITAPGTKYSIFNNYFNPDKVDATGGTSATSITLYDEQGNAHTVSMLFSAWNKERNEWRLQVTTSEQFANVGIDGATSNEMILKFNTDGTYAYAYDRLTDPVTLLPNPSINFFAPNGTSALNKVSLSLGKTGTADGMVISNSANSFSSTGTDGYALGNLTTQLFNPSGEIVGSYSNGKVQTLGQLALALFRNYQGLLKVGDTMFQETGNSGQAVIGTPMSGSRGDINSGMLENSNVDLSMEFVNMIVTQRGFQANSRVVTTSDEMIQELLNLKR